jgi:hypothetical protein|tara:strand:- start:155 stop:1597 length:1443 start_codon:yes stop_codon:yes gene_type:complete
MAKLTFSNSQYGNGTTPENALNNALLQYPEIASTLIQQFPRYTLTLLLEKVGLYASEKVLGDNSFEWKVMGRYNKKQFIASTGDSSHAAGQKVALTFSDTSGGAAVNYYNLYDLLRFQDGSTGLIVSVTGSTYQVECIDAGSNAANEVVGRIGSAFPYGSSGADVGENWAYPETHKNFLTIMRKKCTVTGKDATDVTWIENNGSRLWYFTREQQLMDQFMYEQELQRWYGKRSVASPTSNYTSTNADIFSEDVSDQSLADGSEGRVIIGDGLLAQIDSSNQATYTAGALTEDIITEFLAKLSLNATNSEGNEYLVYTGTEGRLAFHKAMKDLLIAPSGSFTGGSFAGVNGDVELGANFTSYMALGNKITVAYCPVFDDNHMHGSTSGTNAFGDSRLKESAKMVFLDMGSTSGVNNIELITKGAEGMNRSFVKKYVTGMVNPYDANSMMAANADDKFECHVLAESGIVVRNPLSCGILSVA